MITLATLHLASQQEIFNQVHKHLLTQMEKSVSDGAMQWCQYRGPNGLKCAAGALMSDAEAALVDNTAEWVFIAPSNAAHHCELITTLQKVHDCHEPIVWKGLLSDVARKFELTLPE